MRWIALIALVLVGVCLITASPLASIPYQMTFGPVFVDTTVGFISLYVGLALVFTGMFLVPEA